MRWRHEFPDEPPAQDRVRDGDRAPLRGHVPLQVVPQAPGDRARPRRGDHRRGRQRQLHAQAGTHRRRPRHRGQRPLDQGHRPPEGAGLGPPQADGRQHHQAPAALPLGLDLPGLEPRVQRLGRVGRARGQVRVDQAGDQVPPGRGQEEPEVARPDLGHRLDLLPQARLLRRDDHPPAPLPRRPRGRVQA